jgi:hypothetical protein
MTTKTFIRLMFLLFSLSISVMLFSASDKKTVANNNEECPSAKEKCNNKRAGGDVMIWESISNHLLNSNW